MKQFNEVILPKAVPMKPRQSLYSLRHSWRDALRRFDASPATLNALGWSQGKVVSDSYGDKDAPRHAGQANRQGHVSGPRYHAPVRQAWSLSFFFWLRPSFTPSKVVSQSSSFDSWFQRQRKNELIHAHL